MKAIMRILAAIGLLLPILLVLAIPESILNHIPTLLLVIFVLFVGIVTFWGIGYILDSIPKKTPPPSSTFTQLQ